MFRQQSGGVKSGAISLEIVIVTHTDDSVYFYSTMFIMPHSATLRVEVTNLVYGAGPQKS